MLAPIIIFSEFEFVSTSNNEQESTRTLSLLIHSDNNHIPNFSNFQMKYNIPDKFDKDYNPEYNIYDISDKKKINRLSLEGQLKAARISLEQYINPKLLNKDGFIPKRILKNAKGIVFLTCIKAGFLISLD